MAREEKLERVEDGAGGRSVEATRGFVARFRHSEVREHIRVHHPYCPPAIRLRIARRVVGRARRDASLAAAFAIAAENFVRHELTAYDRLRRVSGLARDEARRQIADEVAATIACWSRHAPEAQPA